MRILVTGDRDWTDMVTMTQVFTDIDNGDHPIFEGQTPMRHYETGYATPITIVEGCAPGADSLAEQLADSLGWHVEHHPAHWDQLGRGAGAIRNTAMLNTGIDFCLAFHKDLKRSKGTLDMVEKCLRAGVPTRLYPAS